jgi:hypothetical protein
MYNFLRSNTPAKEDFHDTEICKISTHVGPIRDHSSKERFHNYQILDKANTKMSSDDSLRRNIVKRSSLEEANRYIYPNLTNETTANGLATPGKPYPFFVPSTVKSTLGSPVSSSMLGEVKTTYKSVRRLWPLELSRRR